MLVEHHSRVTNPSIRCQSHTYSVIQWCTVGHSPSTFSTVAFVVFYVSKDWARNCGVVCVFSQKQWRLLQPLLRVLRHAGGERKPIKLPSSPGWREWEMGMFSVVNVNLTLIWCFDTELYKWHEIIQKIKLKTKNTIEEIKIMKCKLY